MSNATLSHEVRNPLNQIMCQIAIMVTILRAFASSAITAKVSRKFRQSLNLFLAKMQDGNEVLLSSSKRLYMNVEGSLGLA